MALKTLMSMFPEGTFDCAMRDRSEGLCAGLRHKTSECRPNAPLDVTGEAINYNTVARGHFQGPSNTINYGITAMAAPYDSCSSLPERNLSSDSSPLHDGIFHYSAEFYLPRKSQLPSPASPAASESTVASETEELPGEREYCALKAAEALNTADWLAFPDELPRDFFQKLAALVVDEELLAGGIDCGGKSAFLCSGSALRSRFLQECVMENTKTASQLWRALDVRDKQELLLAYSCGPEELFRDIRNAS